MNTTNSFPVRVLVENGSHMAMMREKVARAYFNRFQPSGHFQKKLDPFSNLLREHSKLLKNVETMHRRFGVDGGVWFSQNCAKGWKLLAKCYRERQYFSLLDFNASSTNVVPYHQRGISRDRPSFSDMPSC